MEQAQFYDAGRILSTKCHILSILEKAIPHLARGWGTFGKGNSRQNEEQTENRKDGGLGRWRKRP